MPVVNADMVHIFSSLSIRAHVTCCNKTQISCLKTLFGYAFATRKFATSSPQAMNVSLGSLDPNLKPYTLNPYRWNVYRNVHQNPTLSDSDSSHESPEECERQISEKPQHPASTHFFQPIHASEPSLVQNSHNKGGERISLEIAEVQYSSSIGGDGNDGSSCVSDNWSCDRKVSF